MKKLKILFLGIILPVSLTYVYDYFFRSAGNWLEDYQNYFLFGLLLIALIEACHLVLTSYEEKSRVWLVLSVILLIIMAIYFYFAMAFANVSFP